MHHKNSFVNSTVYPGLFCFSDDVALEVYSKKLFKNKTWPRVYCINETNYEEYFRTDGFLAFF